NPFLLKKKRGPRTPPKRNHLGNGNYSGFAILMEYPAAAIAGGHCPPFEKEKGRPHPSEKKSFRGTSTLFE
ncbi:MAG: hypothetical protein Q4A66_04615, partial [Eubacteriales bacterium]|nr:hypothetical protein [Eubacteriales bacterium]